MQHGKLTFQQCISFAASIYLPHMQASKDTAAPCKITFCSLLGSVLLTKAAAFSCGFGLTQQEANLEGLTSPQCYTTRV